MSSHVVIYTDGGADPNPGIGGWAAILRSGKHEKVLTGSKPATTNNRMELTAAIEALNSLKRPCQVELHTDSEYVRKGITEWIEEWAAKGWQRKSGRPIPNAELWQQLWPLVQTHEVTWHWVKGHAGDPLNERVDALARQARLAITPSRQSSADTPRLYLRASCLGNPGPGGWGVVVLADDEEKTWSGSAGHTTNNRMELTAAIEGLRRYPPESELQLFTTSDYVYQGTTRWLPGWRQRQWQKKGGQNIANADLWQTLDELLRERPARWVNVKEGGGEHLDEVAAGAMARAAEAAAAGARPAQKV